MEFGGGNSSGSLRLRYVRSVGSGLSGEINGCRDEMSVIWRAWADYSAEKILVFAAHLNENSRGYKRPRQAQATSARFRIIQA
jgi:hypothetical protein